MEDERHVQESRRQFVEHLSEALPYIRRFSGATIVIKYGGHAMIDPEAKRLFCEDIVLLSYMGIRPVIIHGGGPMISNMLDQLGQEANFVDGLRITDAESLKVVEMVLVGQVRGEITTMLTQAGGFAVGLSGRDGGLILAEKHYAAGRPNSSGNREKVDIGYVGKVKAIHPEVLRTLDDAGFIPVVSPLGVDEAGNLYNINADAAAGDIAAALPARKLIMLTDTPGVLHQQAEPESLISTIHVNQVAHLVEQHVLTGGMLPKIEACMTALRAGVNKAHIIDGRIPHAVLLELFTDRGIGTQVIGDHTTEEE